MQSGFSVVVPGKYVVLLNLVVHRVSDNVGGVKHFLSALLHTLEKELFALAEKQLLVPNKARS